MASKVKSNLEEPMADINIVPFVDIILVVLIVFMVIAPLITKPVIDVNLPKAATGKESPKSQLNILISSDSQILLNGVATDMNGLIAKSVSLLKIDPNTQAIISADKSVTHGLVVEIIDSIKSSGIKKFAITVSKNN